MLSKTIAFCFLTAAQIAVYVLLMIFGWGLEPASWHWIISCTMGSIGIALIMGAVSSDR